MKIYEIKIMKIKIYAKSVENMISRLRNIFL